MEREREKFQTHRGANPRTCRGASSGLPCPFAEGGKRGGCGRGGRVDPTETSATMDRQACTKASVSGIDNRGDEVGPTAASAAADRRACTSASSSERHCRDGTGPDGEK